jgi:hypothetical protein
MDIKPAQPLEGLKPIHTLDHPVEDLNVEGFAGRAALGVFPGAHMMDIDAFPGAQRRPDPLGGVRIILQ